MTTIGSLLLLPESPEKSGGKVDLRGAIVLAVGLALPLFGISKAATWGWGDERTLGMIFGGLLVLSAWVQLESRTAEPLANIAVLRSRPILITNLATAPIGFGALAVFVVVPQLAEAPTSTGYGFGLTAAHAGLLLLPASLVIAVVGPLSGFVGARIGNKVPILIGGVVTAFGGALLAFDHGSQLGVVLYSSIAFAGLSFAFATSVNAIIDAAPPAQSGEATGINAVVFRAGSAVGAQVSGTLLAASALNGASRPTDGGFRDAFLALAAAGLAAAALAAFLPPRGRPARVRSTAAELLASEAGRG